MKHTLVLAILDGWGIGTPDQSNPIYAAAPETIRTMESRFPAGALQASGITVGLPWEEEGNSEVGHLIMGAGKVMYQHFPKISLAIQSGDFFKNTALRDAFAHTRARRSAVHLVGLLTSGNVHASLTHLYALVEMAKRESCPDLYLQLITDGRDSPPESAGNLVGEVRKKLAVAGIGEVASVVGRYYAMNRDGHWDRTAKAYALLTEGVPLRPLGEALTRAYRRNLNDEFIEPAVISATTHPIRDGDAVIFFNFREDSMRQLAQAFIDPAFIRFPRKPLRELYVATMTNYYESFTVPAAFPNELVEFPLGRVLADNGKVQLRISESQKYAHVTYFMNGFRDKPFPNEYRILIPSLEIPHPEERPEMMARAITDRVLAGLSEGSFDFIAMNYANPDIIAHTGNYEATVQAIHVVDEELGRLLQAVRAGDHTLIVTSDHGNAESVMGLRSGERETRHNTNPVPFYLVGNSFEGVTRLGPGGHLQVIGLLADIAPTILELMGIPKPEAMTGESLIREFM
ncbi:MAG: 2,3-bisphosphoglycerate-independent phosphoglycerate mutase [Candidatus Jorgensenbacteria bacterium]